MPTIDMLIKKAKKEEQELRNKYLNKSIYLNRGSVSIVYYVHKVKRGYLYCYHGNEEIRFRPYEVSLNQ